jgi:protein-disulfide isomerase
MLRAFALLIACGTVAAAQGKQDADIERLSRAGEARTVGADTAPIMILEFVDFECPTCSAFHTQRGDSLRRSLAGDTRVVYVNYPLVNHMRSFHSAEAATCAGAVGGRDGFSRMADKLFRGQSAWSDADDADVIFARYAREAGLDTAAFADCRARDVVAPLLLSDLDMAAKLGIGGTPTFVVIPRGAQSANDGFRISGNVSIAEINGLVSQARAKIK